MKIWAHRGCSLNYPENTLAAFKAAANLDGLTGIELDIQLSKDKHLVVIHDETVDRTTNGSGYVKDYILSDLKKLRIKRSCWKSETIPAMAEVLELLERALSNGMLLNIELKNGKVAYEGMEKNIVEMVRAHNLQDKVIYSSFNPASLEVLRQLEPEARIGILDGKVSGCLEKLDKGCPANDLHPGWNGIDVPREDLFGFNVRAFGSAPLFPAKAEPPLDLARFESVGITDVFVNEPETYLRALGN